MKNTHLFLDVFMLVVLCSIIFYTGTVTNCDVTMSHTWISGVRDNVTEIKAVIFKLFHLFTCNSACFGRFACFSRFASFGRFVSLFRVLVHAIQKW